MTTRLRELRIDKIDRVGEGAQPDAFITLVKRRTTKAAPAPAGGGGAGMKQHPFVDNTGSGRCDICGAGPDAHPMTMGKTYPVEYSAERVAKSAGRWVIQKWTDTPNNRRALAAMSPPQALPDGSYPMPNTGYVSRAINALGRAGDNRGRVIALIRRRAKELGMDLTGSNVPELASVGKVKITKSTGGKMPDSIDISGLDLSALTDEQREQIEALAAERDALTTERDDLKAKVPAEGEPPAPTGETGDEDDDDLSTVEGIQSAIAKTRSPEMKRILKASLAQVERLEKQATEDRARAERLEKAERSRVFQARAEALPRVTPYAAVKKDDDGTAVLAQLLDDIDKAAGHDAAEAVENLLTKANTALGEFTTTLAGGERGHSAPIPSGDNPLEVAITKTREADPKLSRHQAVVRVLDTNPELAEFALK